MNVSGLLLTPGAGGDASHHTLATLADAVAPLPALRIDFPYRLAGRKSPDRPPKLIAAIRDGVARIAEDSGAAADRLVLAGRSLGGRMCSMAVAEGLPAAGLVLLSYPLHPPGRPERLRTEHFPELELPCLFISGTRDPFGSPEELEAAVKAIPGPVTTVWLEGQGHDPKGRDDTIVEAVTRFLGDADRRG